MYTLTPFSFFRRCTLTGRPEQLFRINELESLGILWGFHSLCSHGTNVSSQPGVQDGAGQQRVVIVIPWNVRSYVCCCNMLARECAFECVKSVSMNKKTSPLKGFMQN